MRFSESRRIEITGDSPASLTLRLDTAGTDFYTIDGNNQLPEEITLQLDGIKRTDLVHQLQPDSKTRWEVVRNKELNSFFEESKIKSKDEVLIQKTSPVTYRISPLWRRFTFIDLFAGIGGMRLGAEAAGGECLFSSEWDEEAQVTYEANFGDRPAGDISLVNADSIPHHDLLIAGFPCQPFSIIGNRNGFSDTRGTLFFEIERILKHHQPKALLLENVKQFRTHDQGRTCQTVLNSLNSLGYRTYVGVLNALDYGVAQKRERTFIAGFKDQISFSFPEPFHYRPDLSSIFEPEDEIPPSLIASPMIQTKRLARIREQGKEPFYPSMWHENKGGHIGMHPFSCALRHNASYNYLLVNGRRRPTGREMLRLQGFPESFKIVVDHASIRAQAGNSVAVPVITAIISQICQALRFSIATPNRLKQPLLFETG